MESWCFDSLDKGYVSSETVSPSDSIIRTKNVLMGWEFKPPFGYDNSILVPNQQSMENPGFSELGFAENVRKQHPNDSVRNLVNSSAFLGDIISPSLITSNAISGDEESSSKLSSAVVESNCRESSLVDLKLGGFGDNLTSKSSRTAPIVCSAESSTPVKRARLTSLSSQTAYCQVYGCNKDLCSAKEYHKRHKVCDVHSKTAKVIVNGIEQRFCQQCSRFHLLAEFDDGKRSCRKRLAGHNERRRKPQVGFSSNRAGRSLYSYTDSCSIGSKFQGTTSFICQDILPKGPPHAEIYETNMWGRHIKVEDGMNYVQRSDNTCTNGLLHQNSYLCGKQYPPLVGNINTFGVGSVFSENMSQYPSEIVSRSLNEDLKLADVGVAPTVEGCALSLLSSQSQNSSGHLSGGTPIAHPLIRPSSSGPHYSVSEVSEKLFGVGSQALVNGVQNRCSSYSISPIGRRGHLGAMPVLDDDGDAIDSDFPNRVLQGSEFTDRKSVV